MKMTMTNQDSKYGAPVGTYLCKFAGIAEKDHPEYGPGYEWQFEVLSGPHAGKLLTRSTGTTPGAKNACGRLLNQVTGGVELNAEVEIDDFIGRQYQVLVEVNATGNGTRVGTVMALPAAGAAPPPAGAPARPPVARPPAAPPRKSAASFWVQTGEDEPRQMSRDQLQAWIEANKIDDVEDLPVSTADRPEEWKTAAAFGFKASIPF